MLLLKELLLDLGKSKILTPDGLKVRNLKISRASIRFYVRSICFLKDLVSHNEQEQETSLPQGNRRPPLRPSNYWFIDGEDFRGDLIYELWDSSPSKARA